MRKRIYYSKYFRYAATFLEAYPGREMLPIFSPALGCCSALVLAVDDLVGMNFQQGWIVYQLCKRLRELSGVFAEHQFWDFVGKNQTISGVEFLTHEQVLNRFFFLHLCAEACRGQYFVVTTTL